MTNNNSYLKYLSAIFFPLEIIYSVLLIIFNKLTLNEFFNIFTIVFATFLACSSILLLVSFFIKDEFNPLYFGSMIAIPFNLFIFYKLDKRNNRQS